MKIISYRDFFITEKLHINKHIELLSKLILDEINAGLKTFDIEYLPLNIKNINVEIKEMSDFGYLDIDKSYKDNGWNIFLYLNPRSKLDTITHEIDHILKLVKTNKSNVLRKMSHVIASNGFKYMNDNEINHFIQMVYLCDDLEIDEMLNELYGYIKNYMSDNNMDKLTTNEFKYLITTSYVYQKYSFMKNFDIHLVFSKFTIDEQRKFFYLFNEKVNDYEKIHSSRF
jgi:hypothetical protein